MEERSYLEAIERIYDLPGHIAGRTEVFVPTPEQRLRRIQVTREFLDHAVSGWRDLSIVHVVGTSGKGSTAFMLASMLSRRHRTGLVTSPHLFDLRERIRLDLEPIPREELLRVFEGTVEAASHELVKERGDEYALRFPEVILACALANFLERGAEWAVIEAAVGGRYDQSNVVTPAATVITNVSLDHMHQLGGTLEEIAFHKVGTIKEGVPVFTAEGEGPVLDMIKEEAGTLGAPLHVIEGAEGAERVEGDGGGLRYRGRDWPLAMPGPCQRTNAALALSVALDVAGLSGEECAEGLAMARMPGRFEEVVDGVFADVAHNPAKTRALADTIGEALQGRRVVFLVGVADNKDHESILRPLAQVADAVVFTRARYRGAEGSVLADAWRAVAGQGASPEVVVPPRRALDRARELAGEGGAVVVTGSTFVVDETLNPDAWLLESNATYVPPGQSYEGQQGP